MQQGKEPGHLLALFDGGMVVHQSLASMPPAASSRMSTAPDDESRRGRGGLKEGKALGRLYAISGTHPSRAYSVQVKTCAGSLNSNTCYLLYTASGAVFLWIGHWSDIQQRNIAGHVAQRHQQSSGGAIRITTIHERQVILH